MHGESISRLKFVLLVVFIKNSHRLQESLNNLTKWTEKWQIKFNSAKCCVVEHAKLVSPKT